MVLLVRDFFVEGPCLFFKLDSDGACDCDRLGTLSDWRCFFGAALASSWDCVWPCPVLLRLFCVWVGFGIACCWHDLPSPATVHFWHCVEPSIYSHLTFRDLQRAQALSLALGAVAEASRKAGKYFTVENWYQTPEHTLFDWLTWVWRLTGSVLFFALLAFPCHWPIGICVVEVN